MCSEAIAAEDIIASYPAPISILPLLEEETQGQKMKVRKQTETGYYRLSQITRDWFCLATAFERTMNRSMHNAFVSQRVCSSDV